MTALGSVSVCMATYNGALYVEEQIASILKQIRPHDELVVVDDCSQDDTAALVRSMDDARIRLVESRDHRGYARRFEQAISLARGDHIFLADQDDVWVPGRVSVMQEALGVHRVVAGNLDRLGGGSARPRGTFGSWMLTKEQQRRRGWMILKLAASQAPYYGCAMAVRRDLLAEALPLPASARELPDGWLALLGLMSGSMGHVENVVVHRRIHGANTTGTPRALRKIVVARLLFLRMCVTAYRRTHRRRR